MSQLTLGSISLLSLCGLALAVLTCPPEPGGAVGLYPGLDLQGGYRATLEVNAPFDDLRQEHVAMSVSVLAARFDDASLDVNVVHRGDLIVVETSLTDPEQIARMHSLFRSTRFEMRLVVDESPLLERVALPTGVQTDVETSGLANERFQSSYLFASGDAGRDSLTQLIGSIDVPPEQAIILGRFQHDGDPGQPQNDWRTYVLEEALLTGGDVVDAVVVVDEWGASVLVEFSQRGAAALEAATQTPGRRLAIVVGDEVVSAPVIQTPIAGGRAQISMGAAGDIETSTAEANDLCLMLRAGSLPSPLTLQSEDIVEPTARGLGWSVVIGSLLLSLLGFVAGLVRYGRGGLALGLGFVVSTIAMAALALMQAVLNVPLLFGVALASALALATSATTCEWFMRAELSSKLSRTLILVVAPAAFAAMSIAGSLLFSLASGPAKGFSVGLFSASLLGVPLSAAWMWAATSRAWTGPRSAP